MFLETKFEKLVFNSIIYIIHGTIEYIMLSYNLIMPWRRKKTLQSIIKGTSHMLLPPIIFYLINIAISVLVIVIVNPSVLFHELSITQSNFVYHQSTIYFDLAKNLSQALVEKKLSIWSNFIIEPLLCFFGIIVFTMILQILSMYFNRKLLYYEHIFYGICFTSIFYIFFAIIASNFVNDIMNFCLVKIIGWDVTYNGILSPVFSGAVYLGTILINNCFLFILVFLNLIWGKLMYKYLAYCVNKEKFRLKKILVTAILIFTTVQIFVGFVPDLMKAYYYDRMHTAVQSLDRNLIEGKYLFEGDHIYKAFAYEDNLPNDLKYTLMMRAALSLLSTGEDTDTKSIFLMCVNELRRKDYISIEKILKKNIQMVLNQDSSKRELFLKTINDMDKIKLVEKDHLFENWSFLKLSFNSNITLKLFPFIWK